jgi:hypothetical protein
MSQTKPFFIRQSVSATENSQDILPLPKPFSTASEQTGFLLISHSKGRGRKV